MTRTGPVVSWPEINYPMEAYAAENKEAENRTLAEVEATIKDLWVMLDCSRTS